MSSSNIEVIVLYHKLITSQDRKLNQKKKKRISLKPCKMFILRESFWRNLNKNISWFWFECYEMHLQQNIKVNSVYGPLKCKSYYSEYIILRVYNLMSTTTKALTCSLEQENCEMKCTGISATVPRNLYVFLARFIFFFFCYQPTVLIGHHLSLS